MLVNRPSVALKDECPVTRSSLANSFKTPAVKQLIDTVLHQARPKELFPRKNSKELIKPEEQEFQVVSAVEQSIATRSEVSDNSVGCEERLQVVKAISGYLTSMLDDAVSLPEFEGLQPPSISIADYVDRLIRYVDAWAGEKAHMASTGVSAALMGVEYLERLNTGWSMRSVHRLYMAAVLVSVKFIEDFKITNRFWAKVAGIDLQDMNRIEIAFCNMLEWKLQVSRADFESQQNRFAEPVF